MTSYHLHAGVNTARNWIGNGTFRQVFVLPLLPLFGWGDITDLLSNPDY